MAKSKKNPSKPKEGNHKNILKGKLDISRSGMGFVIVEGLEKDIMVKPNDFGKAFRGDTVRVQIPKHQIPGKRVEGKIVDVAERVQKEFTGSMHISGKTAFFMPSGEKAMPDFYIPLDKTMGTKDGDRVVARFVKWDDAGKKPEGEVIATIDAKNAGDMSMKEILLQNNFPIAFEQNIIQAANALNGKITREEMRKRRDCRDILTFTIDPLDAKDFDDALSVRNLDNGNYEIGVHIADVSHFVIPGTELDDEAYRRATSVYLPDRVNPMLPERISNELCSLRPNEDKYCFSAIFEMTGKAEIKKSWLGRTIIHSDQRFTYEQVQEIIETKDGLHFKPILLLDRLAKIFREQRFENGAINFTSQEVRFVLDEDGTPVGVTIKESKDAHQLIEEFMLLANRTVAEYISKVKINKEPIPFPYRIHDSPDEEKLAPFVAFAKKFGYKFDMRDDESVAKSFNELLEAVQGKPEQHVLEQLGIRTMAKAKYTVENIGHYGLGFDNYCHFTSPIRRYPDVLVHRVLQECLDKNVHPDKKMEEKCRHCSERERAAMESERAGNKYKQVEYLSKFLGEEFEAVVSGVATFGFWAETVEHKCEGLVSVKDMVDYDIFRHDEVDYQLVGINTGKSFRIGDKVKIKVVAANLEKRQLDFDWVPDKVVKKGKRK